MSGVSTPEELAAQVMMRVHRELSRRAASAASAAGGIAQVETAVLPRWRPGRPALPEKAAYELQDLLQYDDEQFVEAAYQTILRRPADEAGFQHYCYQLRAGGVSKVEILGNLRWSEEGIQRGVHVDGLLLPYKVQQWRHRRWLGPFLEWVYTLARLPRLARQQAISSTHSVHETRRIGQLLNQIVDGVGTQAGTIAERLSEVSTELHALEGRAQALAGEQAGRIDKLDERLTVEFEHDAGAAPASQVTLGSRVGALETQIRDLASDIAVRHAAFQQATVSAQQRVDERLEALERTCTLLAERISEVAASIPPAVPTIPAAPPLGMPETRNLDALYAAFEEAFRGSNELVKTRVSPYLVDIAGAVTAGHDAPVIDIGCGRGEWLEVLRDAGYHARGIDSNEVFVQACRAKGLDVTEGDAFEVLSQIPDASAAGVTSIHLIEHLGFESLIDFLDESHRILRPGGILILETPNPENVLVGSNWFYMDPTHRNPLPPGLMFWLARSRGFMDVRVERLTAARDVPMPALLPDDVAGAASLNMVLEHFRAPVDYAVIARRSA
ncbi:O-antigen chain-terminating methyltransferase [Pseudoxanthomonas japonensis]|uniref:methyltransferase domain-containing protein n=1 Tax=Pseudoxanthomonas japonensis TaxID=69284 RepID=UPI002860E2B3|nr:methyltransferase domain-containing protein [Pseudoxanthomonas japonensis]MDR7067983.1 O-antigen chain-terminating methyltransferase [Pseudoxanthomonas japonensis]